MNGALIGQSIALKLDPQMAFEALILNRLGQLAKSRQAEWLRGLLVQGFVCECRTLRTIESGIERWRTGSGTGHRVAAESTNERPFCNKPATGKKPLAVLRKVIG